ncbi:MAG: group II truncated hemoglobin [Thiomonas arsenitoxydans]|uniref:Group II truncated hemoglobin n=1 Tax=Thiomonas arsenitoxydans (strain DSM 22701 / CIP 110005 / 3As) TaxID=426114 RepID=A0A8I1N085_THIA3|nr:MULTISPECIES: group II truncated hemoglobin [Thiomonas]MBN8745741.1 group II truncated hemoglobin [Thiomonas arsenitoxydans]ODU92700.1 MAG: globin [Thiomonas sp. SCN 64-16]
MSETIAITPAAPVPQPVSSTPYQRLGGAEGVRRLVDHFYDLMDLESQYADLRAMHPTNSEETREKLYLFLSGWLGGPDLYSPQYGHPRLRMRHFPYAIGTKERDEWMACMVQTLNEVEMDDTLRRQLHEAFAGTADWMRNKAEPGNMPVGNVVHG